MVELLTMDAWRVEIVTMEWKGTKGVALRCKGRESLLQHSY